jgi:hypothetical protein
LPSRFTDPDDTFAADRPIVFKRGPGSLAFRVGLGALGVALLWWIVAQTAGAFDVVSFVVGTVFLVVPAAIGVSLVGLFLQTEYRTDSRGITRVHHYRGREDTVEWELVSPFSETAPTHREGDRYCYLKDPQGDVLMAVGPHLVGGEGIALLAEIRSRLGGKPSLPPGRTEVFKFGDFGLMPPYRIVLTHHSIAAATDAGELRLSFHEIRVIRIAAWPEHGMGLERARIVGEDRVVDFDSRLIGFWPLVDYVQDHALYAEVIDDSRRSRMAGPA